jgi:hypothetical protein
VGVTLTTAQIPCRFRGVRTALHLKQGISCHLLRCKSLQLRLCADSTRTRFRQFATNIPVCCKTRAFSGFCSTYKEETRRMPRFFLPGYGAPGRSRTGDASFAGSCLSHLATGAFEIESKSLTSPLCQQFTATPSCLRLLEPASSC